MFGNVSERDFWIILLYTVNHNDPTHASYMVKDIVWTKNTGDERYVIVRIRPRPGDGQKGQGKGRGKNAGQKRPRQGWTN